MKTILRTWMIFALASYLCSCCEKQEHTKNKPQTVSASSSNTEMPAWYVLKDPSAGFEILMPTKPKKQEKKENTDKGPVTTTAYLSIKDNIAYSVVVTNMPISVANGIDPDLEFDDTMKKLKEKISGKVLKDESEQQVDGNKSRTFLMLGAGPAGQTLYRVKLIRVEQNTIELITAHPKSEDLASDAKSFFESFSLKKTHQTSVH